MKYLTFGELLLRLASPGYTKLFQSDCLDTSFCGAEANVAVSLAMFGEEVKFITKLPENDIGYSARNSLRYFGVDTSEVLFGGGRMGLYYLEKGASQRPSKVIYDRKGSAFAQARKKDFDWEIILDGIGWFHWTGINPALSDEMAIVIEDACKTAKSKGITISCDLNYRGKLWSTDKAQSVMPSLITYADVCICNEEDAEMALGIRTTNTNVETAEIDKSNYIDSAKEISERFGCKYVATTLRKSYSASKNGWFAMIYDADTKKAYFSKEYTIDIVDRVGGGDSFAAALIYGIGKQMTCQEIIDFATASSCLKQTIEGDYNRSTVSDVRALMKSGGNGRVQR